MDGGLTVNEAGADRDTRVEGDSLTHVFFVDATATTENIACFAATAPDWQSMDRGFFWGNVETIPSGNPTDGVFVYVESGVPKVRQPDGTVLDLSQAAIPGTFGGALTFAYTFSTTTTDSDPGSGVLRLNNATQTSAGFMYVDLVDAAGVTITDALDSFNDGGELGLRFEIRLVHRTDPTKYIVWSAVEVASATGYRKIQFNTLLASSASSPFSNGDPVLITATLIGLTGATGATGAPGAGFADGNYGDITISGSVTALTINNDAVTYAKMQNVSASDRLLARVSSGAGNVEEVVFTDLAQSLLDDTTALAARATLDTQKQPKVEIFTASGTYTMPSGAVTVEVHAVGGGAGGGAGRKGAAGSDRYGGGGGGGGEYRAASIAAGSITSPVAITIGAAGTGGVYAGTDTTSGGNGGNGGNTIFRDNSGAGTIHCQANGGSLGSGGTTTTGTGGAGGTGGTGALANANGGAGGNGGGAANGTSGAAGGTTNAGAGGGGGWGLDADNVNIRLGGFGGTGAGLGGPWGSSALVSGYDGQVAPSFATPTGVAALGGGGGGGGTSAFTATIAGGVFVGAAGRGAAYGGGGGGGGGTTNATNSFADGQVGAPGVCIVITRFD